jgi:hypothetical protein
MTDEFFNLLNSKHRPGEPVLRATTRIRMSNTLNSIERGGDIQRPKRLVTRGDSSPISFPGQPGYTGRGEHPSAIPGTYAEGWDARSGEISAGAKGGDAAIRAYWEHGSHRMFGDNSHQSWDSTIDQRMYNSPRFAEAIIDQAKKSPSEWRELDDQAWGGRDRSDVDDSERWDSERGAFDDANARRSQSYWQAHVAVHRGDYDDIEDPYEDAARIRDRSIRPNENLSKQFSAVPGVTNKFVK